MGEFSDMMPPTVELLTRGGAPGSYGYRKSADASYDKVFQKDLARGGDSADENYAMQEAADEVQAKLKERQFAKEQAQVAARDKAHREALARREAEERAADQRREKAALAREEAAHERSSEELIGARPRAESAQAEAVHAKPQAKAAHAKPQAKEAHGALTEDPQEAYEQSEEAAEVTASREAEKAHNVRAWLAARAEKKKVEASASHLEKERESDIDAIIGAAPLPAAAQDGTHNAPEAAHKAAKNAPKSASAPAKTAKKAEAAGSAHAGAPKKAKAAAKEANKAMATQKIEDSIDEDIREMRHLAK
jgi:colicin import membrane protein